MKKIFIALAITVLTLGGVSTVSATNEHENHNEYDKVNVCHMTEKEYYIALWVNKHALKSHLKHDDFLYDGPVTDKGYPTREGKKWCDDNQPGDQCPNIEGSQLVIPEGKVKDNKGNCVDKPPVCPHNPQLNESDKNCEPPVEPTPTPPVVPNPVIIVPVAVEEKVVEFQGK